MVHSDDNGNGAVQLMRIAVLMTCFNRRQLTLAALAGLFAQEPAEDAEIIVYLVDDGSTDGTAAAVAVEFPQVRLIVGDGSLFWNGGMRRAFEAARSEGYDAYLWFNDDTQLVPDALRRLVACAGVVMPADGAVIVAGSIADPGTGERSYGGFVRRTSGLRLDFVPINPSPSEALVCDAVNGNFTLITREVVERIGILDGAFRHQFGDFDYGLRAKKQGVAVFVAPGYYGRCADNSRAGTWRDSSRSFRQRWRNLMSPKGAPPAEWVLYTRRHFGWRWPLYALSPYVKTLLSGLRSR